MSRLAEVNLKLHPKQVECLTSPATEILYGGAAGGGKSHLMRAASIMWATEIPGLQTYLFRRIKEDLVKNHIEGPKGYRNMLAPWTDAKLVEIVDGEIRFWNGSKIYLCHCKDEKHRFKYQGSEIHVLLVDELTHFTEKIYRYLRGRVRQVGLPELPEKYKGMFPRIICGTNPGNVGHIWVKDSFIDGCAPLEIRQMPNTDGGMSRQFIPALLEDNPSLTEDDPLYEARLEGLGSDGLVRAMRYGDWNIVDGAFFDCWSSDIIIKPFDVPEYWTRFRSFDWGSAKPFSVGWWAVSPGEEINGKYYPANAIIRYREWYGKKDNDVGLKLTVEEVADGIVNRERNGERIDYSVADPAIFARDGGPSMMERFLRKGVVFRRADNKRIAQHGAVGGWDQMRSRMVGLDGKPMIYCFDTCLDSIRTIPALQHDEDRPEDLNTDMEDHAADDWRYACMSRPWTSPLPRKKDELGKGPTFNELMEIVRKRRANA